MYGGFNMTYNLSSIANSSDYVTFMQKVNTNLMFGWYGNLILIATAFILFMSFMQKTRNFRSSLVATMALCFTISLPLKAINMIGSFAVFVVGVGFALSIAIPYRD